MKGVIEQQNAEFPAAQLKLIHSGQILKDDSTLAEYKIKEEEFLVCMVTKVRWEIDLHGLLLFLLDGTRVLVVSSSSIPASASISRSSKSEGMQGFPSLHNTAYGYMTLGCQFDRRVNLVYNIRV